MGRDIKFRAWFRPTAEYKADYVDRYGKELPDLEVEYYTEETFLDDSWVNIDDYEQPIIFEQYTGLKDKNGKEIYEGDIISFENEKGLAKVLWLNNKAMFGLKWLDCGVSDELDYWIVCKGPVEVIGNIHETPELLEGEKDG